MSDPFHIKGSDGVTRTLDEHYDGQRDVEEDAYGAWLAIQNQSTRIGKLEARLAEKDAEIERLRALAISGFNEGFEMAASLTPHVYEVRKDLDRAWANSRIRAALNNTDSGREVVNRRETGCKPDA